MLVSNEYPNPKHPQVHRPPIPTRSMKRSPTLSLIFECAASSPWGPASIRDRVVACIGASGAASIHALVRRCVELALSAAHDRLAWRIAGQIQHVAPESGGRERQVGLDAWQGTTGIRWLRTDELPSPKLLELAATVTMPTREAITLSRIAQRGSTEDAGAVFATSLRARPSLPSMADGTNQQTAPAAPYTMRISRLTVDKLGVKLYDKASAVVAELIANSYDADAEKVAVDIPLGTELAAKDEHGGITDKGLMISVKDDGHGMTPEEAQRYFLVVGTDRRDRRQPGGQLASDAAVSRNKKRAVMGRKGIGKLAPFGICRRIEVISSGGAETDQGYLTSHFVLDFETIVEDTDAPVELDAGEHDRTFRDEHGTEVRLRMFLPKRVPARDVFVRQVARRFALTADDFDIKVWDSRASEAIDIPKFQVPLQKNTEVDIGNRPVDLQGLQLPVSGWLAFARDAYKDEEEAGVRIYARGKIVATTRDFEQPAGFTGEFATRSYLVGEVHAEWLDEDDDEDLVRTDRQGILWDSEKGDALRQWGMTLIREIAKKAAGPRRTTKAKTFMTSSNLKSLAEERFADAAVVEVVVELGKKIGAFASEDELGDPDYVRDLAEVILAVAPHQALINSLRLISGQKEKSVEDLLELFGHSRVAEMSSYAQIAAERVKTIKELSSVIDDDAVQERDLQSLIARAPWLIKPDWSVITENQALKTFRDRFSAWWTSSYGTPIEIAISKEKKRPDFTMVHVGRRLNIVELKKPRHAFGTEDYTRLENYLVAFEEFFATHKDLAAEFSDGWQVALIADSVDIKDQTANRAFRAAKNSGQVVQETWYDFISHATTSHEQFLDAHDQALKEPEGDE